MTADYIVFLVPKPAPPVSNRVNYKKFDDVPQLTEGQKLSESDY